MFSVTQTPLTLEENRRILALGTDTRPGFCWVDKKILFQLSPRRQIEDMETFYRRAAALVAKRYRARPALIAFDPHPLFASRRLASLLQKEFFPSARLQAIYHHWAHVANAVFDMPARRPFIGVAFDGTGFGVDGRMWGGEFFYCGAGGFMRAAHLSYQPLAGNEAAIRSRGVSPMGSLRLRAPAAHHFRKGLRQNAPSYRPDDRPGGSDAAFVERRPSV
jgi:hydrogenase maturation protein HypF